MKIIAVTACVTGVAHTYMAAEQLEKICNQKSFKIKIETQGALGIENTLTPEDIETAQVVILASDISIEGMKRFENSRTIKIPTKKLLENPEIILHAIEKIRNAPESAVIRIN